MQDDADAEITRAAQVEPEVQALRVASETQRASEAVVAKHRALLASGEVETGADPFVKWGEKAIDERRELMARRGIKRGGLGAQNRAIQLRREVFPADGIDVLQVLPEQFIEEDIAVGREVRPIPPEPVAALGGVDLHERGIALRGRERRQFALEKTPRDAKQIPAAIFLILADPDVEVTVNPRAGPELGQRIAGRAALEMILDRRAAHEIAAIGKTAIQLAQEGLAAVLESLPCVLTVEDDRDEPRVAADVLRDVPDVREQMLRGIARVIPRRHEADEITQRLFAEDGIHR